MVQGNHSHGSPFTHYPRKKSKICSMSGPYSWEEVVEVPTLLMNYSKTLVISLISAHLASFPLHSLTCLQLVIAPNILARLPQ